MGLGVFVTLLLLVDELFFNERADRCTIGCFLFFD